MLEIGYYDINALSKTALDQIAKSPAVYQEWKNNPPKATESMVFGQLLHEAILEPDKFVLRKRLKCFDEIDKMVNKIKNGPIYNLLQNGLAEHPYFCKIEDEDFKCKVDYVHPERGILIDVKTTSDCQLRAFSNSVISYRYHVQEALYCDILRLNNIEITKFIFIAIEKKPPYLFKIYELEQKFVDKGRELYKRDLETYKRCKETGIWDDDNEKLIELITLPSWAA
jgi:hypothetical protein